MRQLASIKEIGNIHPIENADAIEVATINGWEVVVKKDEFQVGESVVYFEIDSFLSPVKDRPWEFLGARGTKLMGGEEGVRLRSIKLRGQISQGLILPIDVFPELKGKAFQEDQDVSDLLGVIKWEPPETGSTGGCAKGSFPIFIPKTDETRIQSVYAKYRQLYAGVKFYPTLKLDGSSTTIYHTVDEKFFALNDSVGKEINVCSRNNIINMELSPDNAFVQAYNNAKIAEKFDLITETMVNLGYSENYALQSECVGPKIQGSREKFDKFTLYMFSIYDITSGKYLPFNDVKQVAQIANINVVPEMGEVRAYLDEMTLQEILEFAEGPSINTNVREGIVFKSEDGSVSFKAISNKFLLKHEDA